jgi:hypothetical protein
VAQAIQPCAIFVCAGSREANRQQKRIQGETGTSMESGSGGRGRRKAEKHGKRGKSIPESKRAGRDTKHTGDLAEMEFMLQAANKGFAVAKPFGDNEHYDVLVDARPRLWRVQVKSASAFRPHAFEVGSHWSGYKHLNSYSPAEIDLLAAFIHGLRIWYLIPVQVIQSRLTLALYPFGAPRRSADEFEKYREAWHLLEPRASRVR